MQIIIPMSGFGERFRKVGYKVPKPLIQVNNKEIIKYVIDLFPGEDNFTFICNQDHLDTNDFRMQEIIKEYCPTAKIIGIPAHKLGPVHAIEIASNDIDDNDEVIVNYCDFACNWDYKDFLKHIKLTESIGCIPSYKGFHPHNYGKTNYAYLKLHNDQLIDIQEKKPYTDDKTQEYASSGTYYFKSGKILKESINHCKLNNLNINGEYYVSLCYKHLIEQGYKITPYHIKYFMQWGTPDDLNEYNYWSDLFKNLNTNNSLKNIPNLKTFLLMSGEGKRFSKEGYPAPKPMLQVDNKQMFQRVFDFIPQGSNSDKYVISRKDISKFITDKTSLNIYDIDKVTNGQASSAHIGINKFNLEPNDMVQVSCCDSAMIINNKIFLETLKTDFDILVYSSQNYPYANNNPEAYGWLEIDENKNIKSCSIKTKEGQKDSIILGSFIFKNKEVFNNLYHKLVDSNLRINDEFYIDSMIKLALSESMICKSVDCKFIVNWGTPFDYETYKYWNECFSSWFNHPYKIDNNETSI
ncbi:sugar phosphate nucleotidyltransferase [Gammaproteobacteria bacterium]|nr:sugar phosphate nucleotidyltransferase [Gammaproteobacteria bacterium]